MLPLGAIGSKYSTADKRPKVTVSLLEAEMVELGRQKGLDILGLDRSYEVLAQQIARPRIPEILKSLQASWEGRLCLGSGGICSVQGVSKNAL